MKRQDRLVGYQNKTGNEHELSCGAGSDNFILHEKLKKCSRTPRFSALTTPTTDFWPITQQLSDTTREKRLSQTMYREQTVNQGCRENTCLFLWSLYRLQKGPWFHSEGKTLCCGFPDVVFQGKRIEEKKKFALCRHLPSSNAEALMVIKQRISFQIQIHADCEQHKVYIVFTNMF